MVVGKIIKFYREKRGFSQEMLCEGICSKSYLSKFENGKVILSPDIIASFSERLGIDLNEKQESYHLIEKKLNDLNLAIIKQKSQCIDDIYNQLKNIPFILSTKYAYQYLLLLARFYLYKKMFKKAKKTIGKIEKEYEHLSEYEKNFLLHVKGIYYISIYRISVCDDMRNAVRVLNQINDTYRNEEYFYHLALAYYFAGSKLLSYIYARKALNYFTKTHNYVQAINAQSLLLFQYDDEQDVDFDELINKYHSLISSCDSVGAQIQKGILLNNLGVKYFKRRDFEEASNCFEQSLHLTKNSKIYYLRRYYNYVEACLEGSLLDKTELLELIDFGSKLAKKHQSSIHLTLFMLLKLSCESNKKRYYKFLREVAVPQFKSTNNINYYEQYGKKLYEYYIQCKQFDKAIELELQFK
ncbi:helix-turn-helix domain-containing protein [Gottfriedia acidiceleris]|uniref:Helix-turn-helix domain-containing protein n=1 Tax=Gottfriedia acidiceleris TaxID=371036 RepID=A0ABY4JL73_9BACI|nr:helix-turn-helix transcriptional regulator [Gottfriedia acidiceleris]UPM53815.1 helix-turn-helix domain-containing protein [Gottfriedia acidiceleris]